MNIRLYLPVCKPLDFFVMSGMISLFTITEDGSTTEICMIGNEGVAGISAVPGVTEAPYRIEQRLCRWLLVARDRVESYILLLTQEALAHMLGYNRTNVTTATASLKSEGLIEYSRGSIQILDEVKLKKASETGNADVAICALSLSMESKGRWVLNPDELHKPLDQALALAILKSSQHEQQARQFSRFHQRATRPPIMRKFGFICRVRSRFGRKTSPEACGQFVDRILSRARIVADSEWEGTAKPQ